MIMRDHLCFPRSIAKRLCRSGNTISRERQRICRAGPATLCSAVSSSGTRTASRPRSSGTSSASLVAIANCAQPQAPLAKQHSKIRISRNHLQRRPYACTWRAQARTNCLPVLTSSAQAAHGADHRSQTQGMKIHIRPPKVEDRSFPATGPSPFDQGRWQPVVGKHAD